MKNSLPIVFFLAISISVGQLANASPQELPLLTIEAFEYVGAFRIPSDDFGPSDMNYSEGPFAYNPMDHSIFIVGHAHQQAVAQFEVPELVKSSNVAALRMAKRPIQSFSFLLDRASGGNPQLLDRVGGMLAVSPLDNPELDHTELLVNAYEYYDAPGNNTQTTLVVRDANNLARSRVDGFFRFRGGAGHTSGWMSPIPAEWRELLGGSYITGHSSGIPIISRTSVGPSAFVFDPFEIVGKDSVSDPVSTIRLLDYSLENPLHSDLFNDSRRNQLWTHRSKATFGFIVPGTRTYAVFGRSGGHKSGVCYKCDIPNYSCGGYCPRDLSDEGPYYWLYDVNDLLAVRNGQMQAHDVRPYEYGDFPSPIPGPELGGGSFDPTTGQLYLTVQAADRLQGTYRNPPVIIVYQFAPDNGEGSGSEKEEPGENESGENSEENESDGESGGNSSENQPEGESGKENSNGGGKENNSEFDLGNFKKWKYLCITAPHRILVRAHGGHEEELSFKRGIHLLRKAKRELKSNRAARNRGSRLRNLKTLLRLTRLCKRGNTKTLEDTLRRVNLHQI